MSRGRFDDDDHALGALLERAYRLALWLQDSVGGAAPNGKRVDNDPVDNKRLNDEGAEDEGPSDFAARVASTELVGLPLERGAEELCAAIAQTCRANPGARAVKISAYLPSIEVDVVPQDERVAVAIAAYDPYEDVIRRNPGSYPVRKTLSIWIEKQRRQRRADIVPPQAKVAANYTSAMAAKWRARREGYDEILLVDADGFVAEGPTTNVFWVDARGGVHTPPDAGVLLGVTRLSILELARHDGMLVSEAQITPAGLMAAPEVFLTGTTAGVWPVVAIDGRPVGDGEPGPVSLALRERFLAVSGGREPAYDHWLTYVDEV